MLALIAGVRLVVFKQAIDWLTMGLVIVAAVAAIAHSAPRSRTPSSAAARTSSTNAPRSNWRADTFTETTGPTPGRPQRA